ncbi:hypothetical protein OF83DRAFT_1176020 [Amylostereum chailletii]|nr:hypothetical protein OF83DRAFT_1176020 [Amylostereum chailletii]
MVYSENILVAPRPIRISTFSHFHPSQQRPVTLRLTSAPAPAPVPAPVPAPDDGDLDKDHAVSPRLSPRSNNLPSEALEEFLSILRPAFFPPQSPTLRARRYPMTSIHDRSLSLSAKTLDRIENIPLLRDDPRTPAKLSTGYLSPNLRATNRLDDNADNDNDSLADLLPLRFSPSSPLASPVSRYQTRNPFQRNASYEVSFRPNAFSPQPMRTGSAIPASPSMVPLPPPTPSELEVF